MERRDFLKRFGIGIGAVVMTPVLIVDALANEPKELIENTGFDNGLEWEHKLDNWVIKKKWQHHEEIRLIEGQKYRVSFDYKTKNNQPLNVTVGNPEVYKN